MDELVDDLPLTTRILSALRNYERYSGNPVKTVAQLAALTRYDLVCIPNFGRISLAAVEAALAERGLRLGSLLREPDWWRATLNELT